jgi:DNA topoisomerase-3
LNTLILTEKPSVAMDFAKALGIKGKKDGFLEGKGYVITWAVGHLLELAEPEDYDPKWKRWSLKTLPILPESLKYKPIRKVAKQLSVVKRQLTRDDVDHVIIATDAGREGEVIARTILHSAHGGKEPKGGRTNTSRFWTSQALTTNVVLDALEKLRPASDFDRLWHAGAARQVADWLVGMNLSRAATLKLGGKNDTYSVGRVQTAVLALIVDRRREREAFKPEPYWILKASFLNDKGTWWGAWFKGTENRLKSREEADRIASLIAGRTGRITAVKREKKKQPPPPLFSLTDLQRDANSKFGLSAKQTLNIAQGLYEDRKCLSYPRTDSRVLGSQNVALARQLVDKLSPVYPDLFQGIVKELISISNKRVFNDAKLTDHHALIPLAPLPEDVGRDEKRIYELVLKRFAAAFHPDYEFEATEVVTEVEKETFRTKGTLPLRLGWKAVYGLKDPQSRADADEVEEENLPGLEKDEQAKVEEAKIEDKLTQPPPEYTEALLLKDMTNPARYVTEEELQKIFKGEVGLGTQATRAQIIETLITRKYITREKKKLAATAKGCFLIDRLRRFHRARAVATPEETARWEMELEKIAQGAGSREAFLAGIRKFVEDGVEEFKMSEGQKTVQESFGKCPACGGEIIEGKRGYGCANWREADGACRFVIWKEIAGHAIGPDTLRTLLAGQVTPVMRFRSKDGREFSASLKLERDEEQGKWEARFTSVVHDSANAVGENGEAPSGPTVLGRCPVCGGDVVEGTKGYGCKNWRQEDGGCRFVIWKTIAGKQIALSDVKRLLEKGETGMLNGFMSRKGREFSARLKLDGPEFKTTFVF